MIWENIFFRVYKRSQILAWPLAKFFSNDTLHINDVLNNWLIAEVSRAYGSLHMTLQFENIVSIGFLMCYMEAGLQFCVLD